MPSETSLRIASAAGRLDAGWAVLSGADSVCYATGHAVPIETGASPFAGGPTLVIVGPDGTMHAVASNIEADAVSTSDVDYLTEYVGFSAGPREPYLQHYLEAVSAAIDATAMMDRAAVEPDSLPWPVAELLRERGIALVDGSGEFDHARMIKTSGQLEKLRESARIASLAQRKAVEIAAPGLTELELFSEIRRVVEAEAGERTAMAGDLLSGVDRTSRVAGWATRRPIESGDMIIADLAPRVSGYWADSCNTFVVGRASKDFARLYDLAARALQIGIDVALPGTPASVVDNAIRSVIAAEGFVFGHHAGHGIGTSVHEFPRIIPGEETPLEAGMGILLEPGGYQPGVGGVRREWMFEVTATGLVRLTDFEQSLESR